MMHIIKKPTDMSLSSVIIMGLGNPGKAYESTRHNVGYLLIDAFAAKLGAQWEVHKKAKSLIAKTNIQGHTCILVKSQNFMNESGLSLGPVCSFYKIPPQRVIVIQDDITLPKTQPKICINGSSGGHNGVVSVIQAIGKTFIRLKIGIGSKPYPEMELKNYVLGVLTSEEKLLLSTQFSDYMRILECLITLGPEISMNQFNKK